MKKFLINIISFAIIIIIIMFVIEVLLLYIPNEYSYKRDYMEQHINDIECLLLGNSHIVEALDPSCMGEDIFNLAISVRELIYDVELAKKYVPWMNNLKVLILPLDYFNFYFGREIDNPEDKMRPLGLEDTYKCMYYKYMGVRMGGFWCWSEFLNSKLDYLRRFTRSKEENIECDSLGYIPLKLSNRSPNWRFTHLPHPIDISKNIDKQQYEKLYLQYVTIAKLSKKSKIRIVLLGTPMYKTSQKYMSKVVDADIENFVHRLQKDFPNIEYYNYSYDPRFEDDDFHDASHLTEVGAIKFSKIIKKEVLEGKVE